MEITRLDHHVCGSRVTVYLPEVLLADIRKDAGVVRSISDVIRKRLWTQFKRRSAKVKS